MTTHMNHAIPALSDTDRKLLELLVKGASGRLIAERLGYKEGTTRVYLHSLYKRIGVNNKTSAVTWYLDTIAANDPNATRDAAGQAHRIDSFAAMTQQRGLLESLGIMGVFLGPYGRMWEVAQKLKAERAPRSNAADEQLRATARGLWEALVRGDFAKGKRQFDAGNLPKLFVASPSDAVVLAAHLILGGYTSSARKAVGALPAKKGGSLGVTLDELRALTTVSDAVEKSSDSALTALHGIAKSSTTRHVFRHLLLVMLFHVYRMRNDQARAATTANVLWTEAETAREQLEANGDRTLPSGVSLPDPPTVAPAKLSHYLEKLSV